ncbi:porin [Methylobacterium haplocladii]|uniref:Porin n=1 Tax=Methylobacterium haplocladii TaxID=1176176 RepID=A0A512IR68_9HYPH|nr:porin [Methylobacterium haplocladii]GEP00200.1 hypothetical protein MHA02_25870 [Methylobacterium haplocladii]GJD83744.1 hypothetical protein HPGCJGGD_1615 [Methylobacterium haplocladii]GLS57954.1 hypothetical protein GCM10007887_06100 [Methylobacterium haplocladii]
MARLSCCHAIALLMTVAPAAAFERAPLPSEGALEACPEQGAGFGRIPGTTTCIRVSGRIAVGTDAGARVRSPSTAASYGRLSVDTRSQTDAGPLRSFVRIDAGQR